MVGCIYKPLLTQAEQPTVSNPLEHAVMCSVALLYELNGHQKVMAALLTYSTDDTPEKLKQRAEDYHHQRLGKELDGFRVVAWQTAEPTLNT
jgi:hypothetical protein